MDLAAIWNLPVIFVLENNGWSMGTHIARGTAMAHDLKAKAEAFGMRYAECDGLDVLATFDCFKREVDATRNAKNPQWKRGEWDKLTYSREGVANGPCFINVKTVRYQGHSMSDPQKYRKETGEVENAKSRDPIQGLVQHLIEKGLATQEDITALDEKAKVASAEAVAFAEASPDMPVSEMFTDVYADVYGPYVAGGMPNIVTNKNSGQ
jgi:pyruvate dehydrogenase E1 component alpha subunit